MQKLILRLFNKNYETLMELNSNEEETGNSSLLPSGYGAFEECWTGSSELEENTYRSPRKKITIEDIRRLEKDKNYGDDELFSLFSNVFYNAKIDILDEETLTYLCKVLMNSGVDEIKKYVIRSLLGEHPKDIGDNEALLDALPDDIRAELARISSTPSNQKLRKTVNDILSDPEKQDQAIANGIARIKGKAKKRR